MQIPQLDPVQTAIAQLSARLSPVGTRQVPIAQSLGHFLAQPLLADRDSPAANVSAMDGYALRLIDCRRESIKVAGVCRAGHPPVVLPVGQAVQIFTGATVPEGAECVIAREMVDESQLAAVQSIALCPMDQEIRQGQNIRFQGENIRAGEKVLEEGVEIGIATIGSVASFGPSQICVRRPVAVSVLTSGDELVKPGSPVNTWQIRDSNGPTLLAWLARLPWARLTGLGSVPDSLLETKLTLLRALEESDAVVVTGGVSAGDTDFIPSAIEMIGGNIVFHRLPIRPGKPVLGAVARGKLILGLPGNPVSTAITARRIGQPLLEFLAGKKQAEPVDQMILSGVDGKTLPLTWFRLVERCAQGVRLVSNQGSGDFVSMRRSVGFAEIVAGGTGPGPWPIWWW
jgi:molybdopterin molybdotransferase